MYQPKSPKFIVKVSTADSNEFLQKFLDPSDREFDPVIDKLTIDETNSKFYARFFWTILTKISWMVSRKETYDFKVQGTYRETISGDRISERILICSVEGGEIKDTTRFHLDIQDTHKEFNDKMSELFETHVGSSSLRNQISWMKKDKK